MCMQLAEMLLDYQIWVGKQFSWDSQQGRDGATSGRNKKNLISYIVR